MNANIALLYTARSVLSGRRAFRTHSVNHALVSSSYVNSNRSTHCLVKHRLRGLQFACQRKLCASLQGWGWSTDEEPDPARAVMPPSAGTQFVCCTSYSSSPVFLVLHTAPLLLALLRVRITFRCALGQSHTFSTAFTILGFVLMPEKPSV